MLKITFIFFITASAFSSFGETGDHRMTNEVISTVKEVLETQSSSSIKPENSIESIGGDALHIAEIADTLEKQFSITIDDDQRDSATTVRDFIEIVAKNKK